MNHPQGRPFTPEERKFIVSIKQYFDRNKQASEARDSSAQRTADALGIGIATVHRVMASYHNAAYHNTLANTSAPTRNCSKSRMLKWLDDNKVSCNPDCLKVELAEIIEKYAPEPTYAVDEIADRHGHDIYRTPPYHPELQPIELCWGILKNELARHCDFTMKNLEIQLSQAFSKITRAICAKIIKKVRAIEDDFWKEDAEFEEK